MPQVHTMWPSLSAWWDLATWPLTASDVVDAARQGDPPVSHGLCSAVRLLRLRQTLHEQCWFLKLSTPWCRAPSRGKTHSRGECWAVGMVASSYGCPDLRCSAVFKDLEDLWSMLASSTRPFDFVRGSSVAFDLATRARWLPVSMLRARVDGC